MFIQTRNVAKTRNNRTMVGGRSWTAMLAGGLAFLSISPMAFAEGPSCSLAGVANDGYPAAVLVTLESSSSVKTTFCDGSAGYTSEVWLDQASGDTLLGVGHYTASGNTVDLGVFTAGTELVFYIYVRDTGYYYYTGPASRNPDGIVHAAVDRAGEDVWRIGFEDLYGGGDRDFDDINILVSAAANAVADNDGDGIYDDVLQYDSDADGLMDENDACPFENATGFDANGDGCLDDSDGDGVKDNKDRCPGLDDTIDVNGNGRPDCRETGGNAGFTLSGTVYGYCYSMPSGEYQGYLEYDVSYEVSYPLDVEPSYSYAYNDGAGYDYAYAYYTDEAIYHHATMDGSEVVDGTSPYSQLGVQDYNYYGSYWDSFWGYAYNDSYSAYLYFSLSGGDAFQGTIDLPAEVQLSDWLSSYLYYYEYSSTRYCDMSGQIIAIEPIVTIPDSDGDGIPDEADQCPGFSDLQDGDGDGTPDGCDVCPQDAGNDSDGDGSCDSADSCPNDPANDADGDGICADLEVPGCELDAENDADMDGVCAPSDACPYDAQNDADGDGLCADVDAWDDCNDNFDLDSDGTPDDCDVCPRDFYNDSDGDGACDSDDACPLDQYNDSDGDGSCDSDDACPHDAANDADLDGACGDVDACPLDAANDADGDGICEIDDNCDTVSNSNQSNIDGDQFGDACEPDADGDQIVDDYDNCLMVANPDQADADRDGIGNACEADTDSDSVIDDYDACPATPSGAIVDATGCSLDQLVPCDGNWKNHGAYVSAYTKAATAFVKAGLITEEQKGQLTAAAAQSSCGNSAKSSKK